MRRRALVGAALAAGAVLWLAGWIGVLLGIDAAHHVENVGWLAVAAVASAGAFAAALDPVERRTRVSFVALGAGCLSWGLGQLAWTVYVVRGIDVPYPSLSDVGYLAAMPFLAVCVLAWPRRRRVWTAGALVDGVLAAAAVAVLSYTFSFEAIIALTFVAMGVATILPRGWPRSHSLRVPDFLPSAVVTALLGLAAGAFALRELDESGPLAIDTFAVGVLLVLAAVRISIVARGQSRQNARLAEAQRELRLAQSSRDRFLVELVNAQERGSRRIADLLHDDVVQQLTALGFRLELEAQRAEQPRLRELAADTGTITASIRRLLIELHPAILDSQGLAPAIDVVAEGLRTRGIHVHVVPFRHRLPRETETLAYRLVQEALASVLRHSEASSAEVELRLHERTLRGRVSDSGSGSRPAEHTVDGLGLLVARERVELAGGRFLVESGAERGTDVLFELPLQAFEQSAEVAS